MIYFVFVLIAAAAALYLYLGDGRAGGKSAAPAATAEGLLREKQTSLKQSLRDIEYEVSVGKMERDDFLRLQNEYLAEWERLEQQLRAIPKQETPAGVTNNCPQCSTAIVPGARFCHACGARLAQWLFAFLLVTAMFAPADLAAMDLAVTVRNATLGKVHSSPLAVQVLKLEKGMQPVTSQVAAGGKARFTGLPDNVAGPLMVQAVYGGVTYSRVIPPNVQSPAEVTLEIFETTASTERLRVRSLVELRRVDKDRLYGLMILFFLNSGDRTFTGGGDGLEFHLPEKAQVEQASVSVGSGSSNIQWLKLSPKKTSRGTFAVGQNVKPGERILQVTFSLPYDENGSILMFRSLYPQDAGLQLLVEPEDVLVEQAGRALMRIKDPNLGRGLISFSTAEKAVSLTLRGGGIMQMPKQTEATEAEIEVKSPLQLWQKLVFPALALLIFFGVHWLRTRRWERRA